MNTQRRNGWPSQQIPRRKAPGSMPFEATKAARRGLREVNLTELLARTKALREKKS